MNNNEIPFWQDPKNRSIVFQVLAFVIVIFTSWYLFSNTQANLQRQNIATGFEFFTQEAGFEIGESVVEYDSSSTYFGALKVGFLNTFKIAVVGNFFAILIGIFIGILGLSRNWMVRTLSKTYVETFRNIPLLLQLFFWYAILQKYYRDYAKR